MVLSNKVANIVRTKKPDFSKNPYKGVFAYIARKRKVTRQTVQILYNRNSPMYVMLVNNRIAAIDRMMEGNR